MFSTRASVPGTGKKSLGTSLFELQEFHQHTVEPVLSGPVISGHPLLSGQLSKSRKLLPLITVILTSIKRSRSPFAKSRRAVSIVLTCIKRPLCKRKPLKYYSSSYKYK